MAIEKQSFQIQLDPERIANISILKSFSYSSVFDNKYTLSLGSLLAVNIPQELAIVNLLLISWILGNRKTSTQVILINLHHVMVEIRLDNDLTCKYEMSRFGETCNVIP